jgi:hypothetical protein
MTQRSRFFDSVGAPVTLAVSAAADDIIDTTTPHGFIVGQQVIFTALTGGAGLVVGTPYWVVATSLGANTFRVAAAIGGAAIGFTTDITAGTVVGGDRVYNSQAWAEVVKGLIGNGVARASGAGINELKVTETGPATQGVLVALGAAFVEGRYFEVYAGPETLPVTAAHATLGRIDRVVVRIDPANRNASLAVVAGIAAGSPAAPALTQVPGGVWEVSLAQLSIPAASVSVINARITDERTFGRGPDLVDALLLATGHRHDGVEGQGRLVPHANLAGLTANDHHAQQHAVGGADHTGAISAAQHGAHASVASSHRHSDMTGQTANDHHAQAHAIGGADHTGTLAHAATSGQGPDDHHARSHTHGVAGDGIALAPASVSAPVVNMTGVIAGAVSFGITDDYNPAGLATCNVIRLTAADNPSILGGLVAQASGRLILLVNISAVNVIYLRGESAGSAAANRFGSQTDTLIEAKSGVFIWYDNTSSRWRIVANPVP